MSAAGPVENNVCHLTNAALTIDGNALESYLRVPTLVINDFTAVCYGVPLLTSDNPGQLIRLSHATPDGADDTKTAAVVGAGTGLGVGYLHWNDRATRAFPSEAGHADFAPFDEESEQLWSFVRRRTGAAPDAEKFVSGQGLANIADYAHEAFPDSAALSRIADAPQGEKPSMLAEAAATDDACASAMRLFVKMYGRYSGNVALHFLPRYGLYLAGGIVSKNLNWFSDAETFMDAFRSNQVESIESILAKIPVYAITEPAVSYIGAARAVATERAAAAAPESL
jgi:glucokinase